MEMQIRSLSFFFLTELNLMKEVHPGLPKDLGEALIIIERRTFENKTLRDRIEHLEEDVRNLRESLVRNDMTNKVRHNNLVLKIQFCL